MTMRTPELTLCLTTYTDGPQHDRRATPADLQVQGVMRAVKRDDRSIDFADLSSLVEAFRAAAR